MKVPASIYSALFTVAVIAQALVPASAGAEAANPGAGECEALSGGVYYNFTTEQFCDPAGTSGGGATGGGGSGGASGGGGGSGGGSPTGETIFIHDPVQGGIYCGSFADAFVDRRQDCLRGVKVNCSPVDGCFTCPEGGCVAGHPAPARGQQPKGAARKKKPSAPTMGRHEACRQLAKDYRDVTRRYGDLDRFTLSLGFTWDEIYGSLEVWEIRSDSGKSTVVFRGLARTIRVSPPALPKRFYERWREAPSKQWFITQMMEHRSCGEFKDLVETNESDVYYPTGYPSSQGG